jgi:hypothetical protein
MTMIRTLRATTRGHEKVMTDTAHLLDASDFSTDERVAMQRHGAAEWRSNLDTRDPGEQEVFVLLPSKATPS